MTKRSRVGEAKIPVSASRKLKMVLPWVGRTFPCEVCSFCKRYLVTAFHRSDCILYRQDLRERRRPAKEQRDG